MDTFNNNTLIDFVMFGAVSVIFIILFITLIPTSYAADFTVFPNEFDAVFDNGNNVDVLKFNWDFDISDPNRKDATCYTMTNLIFSEYYTNGTLFEHEYFSFPGDNKLNFQTGGYGHISYQSIIQLFDYGIAVPDPTTSCVGQFSINISEFKQLLNNRPYTHLEVDFVVFDLIKTDLISDYRNQFGITNVGGEQIRFLGNAKYVHEKDPDIIAYSADAVDTAQSMACYNNGNANWQNGYTILNSGGDVTKNFATTDQCNAPPHEIVGVQTNKKKGGSGSPPAPPTFGKDKNYNQIVTDGFCFNGNCVNVENNLHVEFPLINATVGEISNLTFKGYNPNGGINGIKWFQVVLGLEEAGQPLSEGEVITTFHLSQTKIESIEIVDKQNLIGNFTTTVDTVQCSEKYTAECLELSFYFIPRDQLINNVVGANIINIQRSSATNYFNDGVEFLGDSLNEPLISFVSASGGGAFYPQDRGMVQLTLISYHDELWQDEYGYLWKMNNYGFYITSTIPATMKQPDLMWSVMNRINSNFADMITVEQNKAILIYDASKYVSVLGESFTYDAPKSTEEQQAILDKRIADEIKRITPLTKDYTKNQHSYQMDAHGHWNHFGDMTLAEINHYDMQKQLSLQDELLQQRINDKEKYR